MNKNIVFLIIVIFVGGGSFYGGMNYAKKNNSLKNSVPNFQNMTAEERQQAFQQFRGGNNIQGGRRNGMGGQNGEGAFLNGEIISKDDKSVTVKLRDGGSKIVFFSDSTGIGKTTEGAIADLETGKQVTINGKDNSDGSVTAQSIQIRPNLPPPATENK